MSSRGTTSSSLNGYNFRVALHQKHFRVLRGSVQVTDQTLLQSLTRGIELLPEAFPLLIVERRKTSRRLDIMDKHFGMWHSHHRSRNRQAHRIPQQRVHVGLARTLPYQEFLTGHLHRNHTKILLIRSGQRKFFEPPIPRCIERHLPAVEVIALDGLV